MDPDATLAELRRLIPARYLTTADYARMRDLFAALDEWITNGGLLPSDWSAS